LLNNSFLSFFSFSHNANYSSNASIPAISTESPPPLGLTNGAGEHRLVGTSLIFHIQGLTPHLSDPASFTSSYIFPVIPNFPSQSANTSRKKRMDLGLLQREVAEIIGVTESTVWNWEHSTEPELQYNPSIIKFLGYIPFDCPDDTVGRLAWYKRAMGMNLDILGEAMGRDPEQLSDWLSGRHHPSKHNREIIERFLKEQ